VRTRFIAAAITGMVAAAFAFAPFHAARAQRAASMERGAPALGSTLASIGTTGRVLTIAAHPDDEDTQLIAWLARGRHVETAYLSLTRGDGGQNLLGNELGEALGAIRTQELLAARRIDGGRQFFTRAYDFGFSKSAEETYRHWPKDSLLGDAVRVIRGFRPHVIVAFFSGTADDGHGHHQVSGLIAREAYELAADTIRFPIATFGLPWTPRKFFRSARQNPLESTLRINTGEYDPLLGRSYYEVSAESRSQHKSQGFGVLQRKGVMFAYLRREAHRDGPADATREQSVFDGIDTTWAALVNAVPVMWRDTLTMALAEIDGARRAYRADDPSPIVETLARALRRLRAVQRNSGRAPPVLLAARAGDRATIGNDPYWRPRPNSPPPSVPQVLADPALFAALHLTVQRLEQAVVLASGIALEATAAQRELPVRVTNKFNVPDSLPVLVTLFNRGRAPVTVIGASVLDAMSPVVDSTERSRVVAPDSSFLMRRWATANAATMPWWRVNGRAGADWFIAPIDARDEAQLEERTTPTVRALVDVAGTPVSVYATIVNRFADPIRGDQQVPVAAVPGISVLLASGLEYVRANARVVRDLYVTVASSYDTTAVVDVRIIPPHGLVADSVVMRRTLAPRSSDIVTFRLTGRVPPGRYELFVTAKHEGDVVSTGFVSVSYDHITAQRMYRTSGMYVEAVAAERPANARVGYIVGVGDRGADALLQLDVATERIEPTSLGNLDLSRFTAIVVGPRAYESNPVLVQRNAVLLEYARRGGHLVVQYGAQDMSRFSVTPFPLAWSRPAARVTVEQAPVRLLAPTSPLLTTPNRIGAADWDGWVQERATYVPSTVDARYQSLLSMNDPDEPEQRGTLLTAPYGRGRYTYVTLALFRQLPAGVPGAARLLLNLVNGAAPPATRR
jgi:LmbE family N-acetylglucosaminyl deacetylase